MNNAIKVLKRIFAISFILLLLAATISMVGCIAPKQTSDLLSGWKTIVGPGTDNLSQPIMDDYQDYIQKLPNNERLCVGVVFFLEDGTGQHAVRFEVALNGTDWVHVLIYDRNDKRIKVIKYAGSHYRS